MKSFAELLSEFINQTGVSDAELARRLGVSRQTVFRWREGLTQRPRHREDVVRMAERLRLSQSERDQLLLAGGFPPDQLQDDLPPTAVGNSAEPAAQASGQVPLALAPTRRASTSMDLRRALRRRAPIAIIGLVVVLAIAAGFSTGYWAQLAGDLELAQTGSDGALRPATPGETLVVITPFVNYIGGQAGFNVAGRLREALELEFTQAGLKEVRVDVASDSVGDVAAARKLAGRLSAALVIWGEYDSGRVIAVVTGAGDEPTSDGQQRRWLISSPGELTTTINSRLPDEVRWMALYVLGRSHFLAGRHEEAVAALNRALAIPPQDAVAQAAVYFYLALLESQGAAPDQDRTIALYSEALESRPDFSSALNNRAVAYINRDSPGDVERAEADLRAALDSAPEDPNVLFNLALAVARGKPERLEEALILLERAEEQQSDSPGIQNGLCWFYALADRPEQALPHCDAAVDLDETGLSNDSRGLTLALLGRREEAISEFEASLAKLRESDSETYQQYAPSRLSWIEALRSGDDPFNATTLSSLLAE